MEMLKQYMYTKTAVDTSRCREKELTKKYLTQLLCLRWSVNISWHSQEQLGISFLKVSGNPVYDTTISHNIYSFFPVFSFLFMLLLLSSDWRLVLWWSVQSLLLWFISSHVHLNGGLSVTSCHAVCSFYIIKQHTVQVSARNAMLYTVHYMFKKMLISIIIHLASLTNF